MAGQQRTSARGRGRGRRTPSAPTAGADPRTPPSASNEPPVRRIAPRTPYAMRNEQRVLITKSVLVVRFSYSLVYAVQCGVRGTRSPPDAVLPENLHQPPDRQRLHRPALARRHRRRRRQRVVDRLL